MHWVFKNKDQGKTAAAASLGLIMLWDVESGLPQVDKFLYSKDPHVVAGMALAAKVLTGGHLKGCTLLHLWTCICSLVCWVSSQLVNRVQVAGARLWLHHIRQDSV